MRKFEIVLLIIPILAILARVIFHFAPGANELIILSWSSLGIMYFLFGFSLPNNFRLKGFRKKKHKTSIVIFSIVAGFAFFFALHGLIFRFQFFPGDKEAAIINVPVIGAILAVTLFLKYKRPQHSEWANHFVKRAIVLFIGSVIVLIVDKGTLRQMFNWRYPELVALQTEFDELEPRGNYERREELIEKISDLREELYAEHFDKEKTYYGRGHLRYRIEDLSDTTYSRSCFNRYKVNQLDSAEIYVLVDSDYFKYRVDVYNEEKVEDELRIYETEDSVYFELIKPTFSMASLTFTAPYAESITTEYYINNRFQGSNDLDYYQGYINNFGPYVLLNENDEQVYSGTQERILYFDFKSEQKKGPQM